eukprot:CAMPEP_0114554142 /NCGR_PEP_ID=MMETSP0114-20121206/8049_1 /TAXON_ID=31324 /ORGANISM="Goniomonas sp, Strain m" /LENGTH=267 /DNA_ID=CAMNT_0001739163 /DNA_START=12 /DNA_END=815 /DNA_ORIENTATION=-
MALEAALDLMRRMPPGQIQEDLGDVLAIVPDLVEDLLSAVDPPLKEARDPVSNKDYLLCDYNRDGDSYRSPWSNQYDPPLDDGIVPTDELRKLEITANEAFDQYREQYYEGGVSSAYFWENDGGFACCIVIKKDGTGASGGTWNSIHVVEVKVNDKEKQATYTLVTTIMLALKSANPEVGSAGLAGNLTRREEKRAAYTDNVSHLSNIGDMIEKMENRMRESMSEVYFGKTKEIVDSIKSSTSLKAARDKEAGQKNLIAEMMKRQGK